MTFLMDLSFHRWSLLLAAVVFAIAAWFGVGYHAEDEQRHVIEFAEGLRGNIPEEELAIEYHMRIRSMVQPVLCAAVFEACEAIGISDPFVLTLLLRLITAALALWIIHGFVRSTSLLLVPDLHRPFILLSYFLWFIPVLNIRFTGEAWSGLLFLRGLSLLTGDRTLRQLTFAGLWFGAAILFRPAAAMLPFGAMLWLVAVQRIGWRDVFGLLSASVLMLLLGVAIDSMAYGEPVFTFWNYARAGIGGDEAWRFTTLPWYHHILFIAKYAVPPIGIVLLASFAVLVILRPKHPLVWIITPFLIAHSILPVKELRFLFPLAPLMPWLLVSACAALRERLPGSMRRRVLLVIIISPLVLINAVALVVSIATPAGNGRIRLAQVVEQQFHNMPVRMTCSEDWRICVPPFYLPKRSTARFVRELSGSDLQVSEAGEPVVLIQHGPPTSITSSGVHLHALAISHPRWTLPFMRLYGLEDGFEPLVLAQPTVVR